MYRFFIALLLLLTVAQPNLSHALAPPAVQEKPTSVLSVFDSLHLVGQDGKAISDRLFRDKVVVLNFIFTKCDTSCPVQTRDLAAVQASLPREVRSHIEFISVSVDPEEDSPSKLTEYASMYHIDLSDWVFVTGSRNDIGTLTSRFDSFAPSGTPALGRHTTDLRVFSPKGKFLQRYSGVPIDKDRVLRELTQLVALYGHQ